MPHYKCTGCHHEFDYIPEAFEHKNPLCDWCGAPSIILENKTPMEKMFDYVEKHGWDKLLDGDGEIK
jgi:rRNA maturation endonuclease Nob1